MTDKIYCGNGKSINTKYGELLKISFNSSDIEKMQAHMTKGGWVNLNVSKRKETGKHGETHYLTIDTWKPEKVSQEKPEPQKQNSFDDEQIPF